MNWQPKDGKSQAGSRVLALLMLFVIASTCFGQFGQPRPTTVRPPSSGTQNRSTPLQNFGAAPLQPKGSTTQTFGAPRMNQAPARTSNPTQQIPNRNTNVVSGRPPTSFKSNQQPSPLRTTVTPPSTNHRTNGTNTIAKQPTKYQPGVPSAFNRPQTAAGGYTGQSTPTTARSTLPAGLGLPKANTTAKSQLPTAKSMQGLTTPQKTTGQQAAASRLPSTTVNRSGTYPTQLPSLPSKNLTGAKLPMPVGGQAAKSTPRSPISTPTSPQQLLTNTMQREKALLKDVRDKLSRLPEQKFPLGKGTQSVQSASSKSPAAGNQAKVAGQYSQGKSSGQTTVARPSPSSTKPGTFSKPQTQVVSKPPTYSESFKPKSHKIPETTSKSQTHVVSKPPTYSESIKPKSNKIPETARRSSSSGTQTQKKAQQVATSQSGSSGRSNKTETKKTNITGTAQDLRSAPKKNDPNATVTAPTKQRLLSDVMEDYHRQSADDVKKAQSTMDRARTSGSKEEELKAYAALKDAQQKKLTADMRYGDYKSQKLTGQLNAMDYEVAKAQGKVNYDYAMEQAGLEYDGRVLAESGGSTATSVGLEWKMQRGEDSRKLRRLQNERDKMQAEADALAKGLNRDSKAYQHASIDAATSQIGLQSYQAAINNGATSSQAIAISKQQRDMAKAELESQFPTLLSEHKRVSSGKALEKSQPKTSSAKQTGKVKPITGRALDSDTVTYETGSYGTKEANDAVQESIAFQTGYGQSTGTGSGTPSGSGASSSGSTSSGRGGSSANDAGGSGYSPGGFSGPASGGYGTSPILKDPGSKSTLGKMSTSQKQASTTKSNVDKITQKYTDQYKEKMQEKYQSHGVNSPYNAYKNYQPSSDGTPTYGNSAPSWNPKDPNRPGLRPGDWSVSKLPDEAGGVFSWMLGGKEYRPDVYQPKMTPQDIKYQQALPNAYPYQSSYKSTSGSTQYSPKVTVKAGDPETQKMLDAADYFLGPKYVEKKMAEPVQAFVDTVGSAVQEVGELSSMLAPAPQPSPASSKAATPVPAYSKEETLDKPDQKKLDELKSQEIREKAAAKRAAAEPAWSKDEGSLFRKEHGTRPKDPATAKNWDHEKADSIRRWMHAKQWQADAPAEYQSFLEIHGSKPTDPVQAKAWIKERDQWVNKYNTPELRMEDSVSDGGIRQ